MRVPVHTLAARAVLTFDVVAFKVLHNHQAHCINLTGIDCPDNGRADVKRAKRAGSSLAFVYGKEFAAQTHGYDKFNRTIGDLPLSDGTNVNHAWDHSLPDLPTLRGILHHLSESYCELPCQRDPAKTFLLRQIPPVASSH